MNGWLLPPAALLDLAQELADLSESDAADLPAAPAPAGDPELLATRLNARFGIGVSAADVAGLDAGQLIELVHLRMS